MVRLLNMKIQPIFCIACRYNDEILNIFGLESILHASDNLLITLEVNTMIVN